MFSNGEAVLLTERIENPHKIEVATANIYFDELPFSFYFLFYYMYEFHDIII